MLGERSRAVPRVTCIDTCAVVQSLVSTAIASRGVAVALDTSSFDSGVDSSKVARIASCAYSSPATGRVLAITLNTSVTAARPSGVANR